MYDVKYNMHPHFLKKFEQKWNLTNCNFGLFLHLLPLFSAIFYEQLRLSKQAACKLLCETECSTRW